MTDPAALTAADLLRRARHFAREAPQPAAVALLDLADLCEGLLARVAALEADGVGLHSIVRHMDGRLAALEAREAERTALPPHLAPRLGHARPG